ncbi:Fic family protein [Hellea sp.]|nr:Fic family protein [Hellea sp.]
MNLNAYISGQFKPQYEYDSFEPSEINHAWDFTDAELVSLLGEANRALGELNAYARLVPDIRFIIQSYIAKEATQSSRIEGTQTNIEDAFKDEADIAPEARDDWGEVQNYIKAIHFAVEQLETLPFSNRLLRDTHSVLMQGVRGRHKRPGEFRVSQNWIGVSLKNAVFIPPHHTNVEALMGDLESFLHSTDITVPPLIRIAIAHYQFETVHPFLDGNGRLGRLMISLYLAANHLLDKPVLYLSDYFERNKTAYIDHLMAVRQGHHMRDWLIFFLHGVEETARSAIAVSDNILTMKARIEQEILPRFSSRRQNNAQRLMQHLYGMPVIDIKNAETLLQTTAVTANSLVSDFEKYGILREITGNRRNRLYVFEDYLDLFRRK